ncbi:alpha/beta fold hydrolase [Plasticicumulans acidivorans]|uniref:Uncharacterized protein DUF3141 n=1 Tax=Plasticicumulans acidivorans TaxID=886464 RepID=A0A317MZ25_9GAMM|nr:alpha/beta fold hydrolase [Plasticicumulans acidivorans]PWV64920.1 uncharacterized protein DUF3141 [Plasticicumulans acidivorans]
MDKTPSTDTLSASENSLPLFWPLAGVAAAIEAGEDLVARNAAFALEAEKIDYDLRAEFATPNQIRLDLHTLRLRDFTVNAAAGEIPTLVDAPFAGHTAVIADYHRGQSLVETLLGNGLTQVCVTDWKSATPEMKDYDIDHYLAELNVCIDDLGGKVNLVGLCQGGWMSAMLAARFPHKVNTLVLAGAPIDTAAGDGPIKRMALETPTEVYAQLVELGGGVMKGRFMLQGWKNMHPEQQYLRKYIDLWEHVDDPAYLSKTETFERWYESTVDLPGRWYMQAIVQLFKENRFARGEFVGLGRKLDLHDVRCPVYLLAGESDDITTKEQVFDARKYLGTPPAQISSQLVPGGHIGLFMGSHTLRDYWPGIARWIASGGQPAA